jgi:predicted transcriptional regulator
MSNQMSNQISNIESTLQTIFYSEMIDHIYNNEEIEHMTSSEVSTYIREITRSLIDLVNQRNQTLAPIVDTPRVYSPKVTTKTMSLFDLNSPCAEDCSICFEKHKKVDSLITDCNHEFGKECYNKWILTNNNCPICRKKCENITVHKGNSRKSIRNKVK